MNVTFIRPHLYAKQETAIFNESRFSFIEASTKAGKTVACIAWLAEQAMLYGGENRHWWWVAPIYGQAEIAFRRMKQYIPKSVYTTNESSQTIRFSNGATVWFKSGEKPDSLYGEDVQDVVIDEGSRVREESWNAVLSTLTATRGRARVIGNVKGRGNWFYRLSQRAKTGDEAGWEYHRITAADAVAANVIDFNVVLEAKRLLPNDVFNELYLCIPSDDGGNPFNLKAIDKCVVPSMPESEPVCWGWDLAKSVDWTVGVALDSHMRVCRIERFRKPWLETIKFITTLTGGLFALVDSTGVGDPILEALQRPAYFHSTRAVESYVPDPLAPPQYEPVVERFRSAVSRENFQGFKFNSTSKQQLMEGLAVEIQQGNVKIPNSILLTELQAFEYEYGRTGVKYSAPAGMHDDCVCALALAIQAFHRRPTEVQTW